MEKSKKSAIPYRGMTPKQIKMAVSEVENSDQNKSVKKQSLKRKPKPQKVKRQSPHREVSLLLNLPYSITQIASQLPTPEWFTSTEKVEISIIVPLYKNSVDNLVDSWDLSSGKNGVEFIFVDDNCPWSSKNKVVAVWETRKKEIKQPIGKIVQSSMTQGWGACCNIGAKYATGNILIFLHPEGKLFPGWLNSLTRLARKTSVGIVGALHVNEPDDTILEAGKEWSWKENGFLEIGSQSYDHKTISRPFQMDNAPKAIFEAAEREMVSSLLAAIKKDIFLDIGGFSPNLFTQAWSDADICMRIKERNLKVMYQPNARLYRISFDKKDRYYEQGSIYFHNKWIASGRIDHLVSDERTLPKTDVKNILIRRQSSHGDVLIAAAVARALKVKYPGCRILFATDCPEVVKNNPWIDRVVDEHSERQFNLFCNLDMAYEYRPRINILTAYAEAVGVDEGECALYLHTEVPEVILPENYIVMHAGNTLWAGRNWSSLKFDQISARIREQGYNIVCVGMLSDHKPSYCDLDLRGKTTVHQLGHVIKNSQFFIGIDSFPMHIAQTFNIPGVAFFGSILSETRLIGTSISPVQAKGVRCLGCHHNKSIPCTSTTICEVGIQECINSVSVDTMWDVIKTKLMPDK